MNEETGRGLAILNFGFTCAAGSSPEHFFQALKKTSAPYSVKEGSAVFAIPERESNETPENGIDRAVHLAIRAAMPCIPTAEKEAGQTVLVNVGSSRGASSGWEREYSSFKERGNVSVKASPFTTPGNLSSHVASLLKKRSVTLDHSVTCGSGLQAIANAFAWIKSGLCDMAIAGGTEAPLTPFTMAQMKALKIVSSETGNFPTRPLSIEQHATGMLLGEGAAMFTLASAKHHEKDASYFITGIGMGHEFSNSPAGISSQGEALQKAMAGAMTMAGAKPDLIMAHAPGTKNGDLAEHNALLKLFGDEIPHVYTNKHIIGHTLGASGVLSLITALILLEKQEIPPMPYPCRGQENIPEKIRHVLINATGFGGNAISIMVSKNDG
jgi:3-oxoacyl-(acyl-carrier-protein) synthase